MEKKKKKLKGYTGSINPADYGIDVNADFKSHPSGSFNVNTMKQAKKIDVFKKDNNNAV